MEALIEDTGEVFDLVPGPGDYAVVKKEYCPNEAKLKRFGLLNQIREVLPNHRTSSCLRYPRQEGGFDQDGRPLVRKVEVWKSLESSSAHYKNLTVCGRVWTCPVCTAKINEGRRLELKTICEAHERASGRVLMITKTFSHGRFDNLSDMLSGLSKANERFWRCAEIKRLRESLGLVGYIRTTEITWGHANGWHPHYHELWLVNEDLDFSEIKRLVFRNWRRLIEKVGLGSPNEEYGVHVRGASDAWDYITKFGSDSQWDYSHEMTRHHVKKSKKDSFTPFGLLERTTKGSDESDLSIVQAKALFSEYADSLHGRRQLQYSRGLKNIYQVDDVDDQELAEAQDQEAIRLASLTANHWKKILWSDKKKRARATVLILAAESVEALWNYVDSLPDPPEKFSF